MKKSTGSETMNPKAARRQEIMDMLIKDLEANPQFVTIYASKNCKRCYGRGAYQWDHPHLLGFQKHGDGSFILDDSGRRQPFGMKVNCDCIFKKLNKEADKMLKEEEAASG